MNPGAHESDPLTRLTAHRRGLAIVHICAFVGTGLAALAMDPAVRLPANPGRSSLTALRVLWVGWPFVASFAASRTLLPGKTLAIWLFVAILAAVTVVGGIFLDSALANDATRWEVFKIALAEALLLTYAARFLGDMKRGD